MASETTNTKSMERFSRWFVPIFLIAFASGAIYISTTFKKMPAILKRGIQPSDFPQLVCALIIFLVILMVLRDPIRLNERAKPMTWVTMAAMLLFVGLVQVDLFLALAVFAVGLAVLWGERRTSNLAIVGFAVPLTIFFLFDFVFKIRFPRGLLTSVWYG